MKLDDLISFSKSFKRQKTNDILVIIVFFNEYEHLEKHLRLLAEQTYKDFDILIVSDPVTNDEKTIEVISKSKNENRTTLVKMREPDGPAAAYFIGDKFAVENEYKAVIYADIDAFPTEEEVIEKLVSQYKKGNKIVGGTTNLMFNDKAIDFGSGGHHYSLVATSLLKEHGFHFAPVFIGGDDGEFYCRLFNYEKLVSVKAKVTHSMEQSIFAHFERSVLYRINAALVGVPCNLGAHIHLFGMIILPYLLFGTRHTREAAFHIVRKLIENKYGKKAFFNRKMEGSREPEKYGLVISPIELEKTGSLFVYKFKNRSVMKLLNLIITSIRKKVLVYVTENYVVAFIMAVASETWISSKKGKYKIAENKNMLLQLIKIIIFVIGIPIFSLIGIPSFFVAWARKPKTERYGLDD